MTAADTAVALARFENHLEKIEEMGVVEGISALLEDESVKKLGNDPAMGQTLGRLSMAGQSLNKFADAIRDLKGAIIQLKGMAQAEAAEEEKAAAEDADAAEGGEEKAGDAGRVGGGKKSKRKTKKRPTKRRKPKRKTVKRKTSKRKVKASKRKNKSKRRR